MPKLKASIVMLMATLLLVAGCTGPSRPQQRQESQSKPESTTTSRMEASVVLNSIDSKDEAINAVFEHLSARALNPRAQAYLQDFLHWVDWPDKVEADRYNPNQLAFWYVLARHHDTIRFVTPPRPYWSSAAWLVLPNGEVQAHIRHSGNAWLIGWDLIALSMGEELPEGRWLPDIEQPRVE